MLTDTADREDETSPEPGAVLSLGPRSAHRADDLPCRRHRPDLWFAEEPAELVLAKALCRRCPARLTCLSGALARREPWGVWGGEIVKRGRVVARKLPRGRPRKSPVSA